MRLAALALNALAVVSPAAAEPAAIKAQLTTTTRAPVVGEAWRYTVVVRNASRPAAVRMRLQILNGRSVVGCWRTGALRDCTDGSLGDVISFRGKRTGVIRWSAEWVGVRLMFQAVVQVGARTLRLRAPVTVRPAR